MLFCSLGMAKIINQQGLGNFGTVFKVVPLPGVTEHCFQLDGQEGAKVMPQSVLPDITNYTVSRGQGTWERVALESGVGL